MHGFAPKKSRSRRRFVLLGLALSVLYLAFEAMVHSFIFDKGGFMEGLLASDRHELWMHLLIVLILMAFGLYADSVVAKRRAIEDALRERLDELERFRKATVARELRMKELRERIVGLEKALAEAGHSTGGAGGRGL